MLMANSDVSSSIIPNSIKTLDENESIEAHVVNVQSLALSSPNRDRGDDNNNHDSLSIPPPIYDGYTSSSSDETQSVHSPINLDHDEFSNFPDSQTRIGTTSQALDDIDDDLWDACPSDDLREAHRPWTPNVSPGFGSDDDDDNSKTESPRKSLFGFPQEPEPVTGVVCSDFVFDFGCIVFNFVL